MMRDFIDFSTIKTLDRCSILS